MSATRDKVVVAMSGGVDSSVAACLLVEQGYDVTGLFMRVGVEAPAPGEAGSEDSAGGAGGAGADAEPSAQAANCTPADGGGRVRQGCCSADDAADARFVAGQLGIPFYALNFERSFDELIEYFVDEYARGRTPNPCVHCNDRLKFGELVDYADAVGARHIATGHYAQIGQRAGQPALRRGCDAGKDQSYVLFGLQRAVLSRVLLPVGGLEKSAVRELATRFGLPNRDKPDSVEICFVPDQDYARLVRERRPGAFQLGDVLDSMGQVVGKHRGLPHYTVGQRRGLGISAPEPRYVTHLDVERNTVTIGSRAELHSTGLRASRANFLVDPPAERFRGQVQIRYLHRAAEATIELAGDAGFVAWFDEPQPAVTPGQAAVVYQGDLVIGGGWIDQALSLSALDEPTS